MNSILYYISGHGYGHAVRSNQVIKELKKGRPDLRIHVRSTAPHWLFDDSHSKISHTNRSIDIGIIQPNSLEMDLQRTLRACQKLHANLTDLVRQEVAFIKAHEIGIIIGDIPPICFEIAARANIPSVAITNFTWDTIYRFYLDQHPDFSPLVNQMTDFYGKATLALALPYPCDMSMFRRRKDIPWITRTSRLTREQARSVFHLPMSATTILLSFGGLGLDSLPWKRLNQLRNFFFVVTGPSEVLRSNLLVVAEAQQRYEDLVRAVDVIVTKPGYGIVADVISHRVPILYTDRGPFAEYPKLVEALNECASAEYIPQIDLLRGNLAPYLERLLSRRSNWPDVRLDGAYEAAKSVSHVLEKRD